MPKNSKNYLEQVLQQLEQLYKQQQQQEAVNTATVRAATQAYELAVAATDPEDIILVAKSLESVANLYAAREDHRIAADFYKRAAQLQAKTLGHDHNDVPRNLNMSATFYEQAGDFATAEPLYQEAMDIWRRTQGSSDLTVGSVSHNLAFLYHKMGRYTDAEPLYHQALAIYEEYSHIAYQYKMSTLSNLGGMYRDMRKYPAAIGRIEELLDLQRQVYGEHHPVYIRTTGIRHMLYGEAHEHYMQLLPQVDELAEQGQFEEAIIARQHVVDIIRRLPDGDSLVVADYLGRIGWLYHQADKLNQAEPPLIEALALRRKALGDHDPAVATSLNDLGILYKTMGNYARALPLFEEALAIYRSAPGDNEESIGIVLNSLGQLYKATGDYPAAEKAIVQALDTLLKLLGEHHMDVARTRYNLGHLYRLMGNYPRAQQLMQQALDDERAVLGKDHLEVAHTRTGLAQLYYDMGDYDRAVELLRQVLETRERKLGVGHRLTLSAMNDLALVYLANHAPIGAAFLTKALALARTSLGEQHPSFAQKLSNMGSMLYQQGRFDEAQQLLEEALEIRRKVLSDRNPEIAESLHNLAQVYLAQNNIQAGEPLLKEALGIVRTALGPDHPIVALCLNNLGSLYADTGRELQALELMTQAAAIQDGVIGLVFSIGSDRQRMAYLQTLQASLEGYLSVTLRLTPHALAPALDLVLRRKALASEALATQRDAILGGRYPALAEKLQALTDVRRELGQRTLAGPGGEGASSYHESLTQLRAQQEQLENVLARHIPELNLTQQLQSADRVAVAQALPDQTVLIEFVRSHVPFSAAAHYLAFVLPARQPDNIHLIDLGPAEGIDKHIADFRDSLIEAPRAPSRHLQSASDLADGGTRDESGELLRKAVFDPLVPTLDGKRQLVLAPDGDLSRLPFEVLPIGGERRLIDEYAVTYLGTGRDALRFKIPSTTIGAAPVIAVDPNYDLTAATADASAHAPMNGRHSRDLQRGSLHFSRLPETRVEGEQIARLLGVEPLVGDAVLEGRVKACKSPRILHLATHGFFLTDQETISDERMSSLDFTLLAGKNKLEYVAQLENPLLRSGLALAGANGWVHGAALPTEAEDAILTADDVAGLDLLHTDLVVLSACESGLGQIHVGEGVFGLRRAFNVAGAKTLVMSLWKVPDQQTQELMVDFYRRLLAGQGRAEALRYAQLAMKERYPDPFYWGAFICQGDPSPLTSISRAAPAV